MLSKQYWLNKLNYPTAINTAFVLVMLFNLLMLPVFITLNYDIRGVESNVVFTVQNLLRDNTLLYANPENVPFSITQYSPLYYMMLDGVLTIFDVSASNGPLIRIISRSVSLVLCFLMVVLIYSIVHKKMRLTRKQGVIFGLTAVSFTLPWYYLTRPDILVAVFYLLFIKTTYAHIENKSFRSACLMGALAFLALASKQNGIFLIGIGGLYFLYYKDFKGLFYAFLGFSIALLVFSLVFNYAGYEADYMLKNIMDGVNNGFGFRSFFEKTLMAYFSMFGFFAAGTAYIIYFLFSQEGKVDKKLHFTIWFAVFLFLFSTLTALKKGSAVNYYNEVLLVSLLLWGFYIKHIQQTSMKKEIEQRAILFMSLSCLMVIIFQFSVYFITNLKHKLTEDRQLAKVEQLIGSELGEEFLYSEVRQVSLKLPQHVLLAQFDIAQCCAYPKGIYNYTELCNLIQSGKVKFLIFDSKAPESLYGCDVSASFMLYKEYGRYHIYKNFNIPGSTLLKNKEGYNL